jgi:hypothetical protein
MTIGKRTRLGMREQQELLRSALRGDPDEPRFGDGREELIDHAAMLSDIHAEQLAWAWLRGYWTAIEDESEQD